MKTGGMMVTTRMKINQILMTKTMQMKMIGMRRSMATMKMIMILIKIMMSTKIHNIMTMMTMTQMMTTHTMINTYTCISTLHFCSSCVLRCQLFMLVS